MLASARDWDAGASASSRENIAPDAIGAGVSVVSSRSPVPSSSSVAASVSPKYLLAHRGAFCACSRAMSLAPKPHRAYPATIYRRVRGRVQRIRVELARVRDRGDPRPPRVGVEALPLQLAFGHPQER